MLKKLLVLFFVVIILSSCGGNNSNDNVVQNNASNIANGQVVDKYKNFTYITMNGIYRYEKGFSNSEKILAEGFWGVHIVEDWLYTRSSETDNRGMYRVKLDGSGMEKLSDEVGSYINVDGNSLYYSVVGIINPSVALPVETNSLTIRYDGSREGIFKLDIKTKDIIRLAEDKAMYLSLDGDWIYYLNYSEEGRIYKISTNGKTREALGNEAARFMVTEGEWIYYIANTGDIKRIKKNSTEEETVLEANGMYHSINVSEDWIYIGVHRIPDGHLLLAYNIKTHEEKVLYEGYPQMINVIDSFVYFSSKNEYTQMNLENGEAVTVIFD